MPPRKKKKVTRKKAQKKIPILFALGVAAGLAEPVEVLLSGNLKAAISTATRNFVGYDIVQKNFVISRMKGGLVPAVVGAAGSIAASKAGVNRRFSIPWFKA